MAYEKDGKLYDERTHALIKDQDPGVPDSPYVGKHSLNSEDDDERERGLRSSAHREDPLPAVPPVEDEEEQGDDTAPGVEERLTPPEPTEVAAEAENIDSDRNDD